MTDAELFARLGQLLDVIEGLRQEMRDGFAAADRRAAKIEADVSELKADVSELRADISELKADVSGLKAEVSSVKGELAVVNKRLTALENEMLGIKQAQAVMNARLEDQWRVVTALIPTRVAAVGVEPAKSAGKR